MKGRIVSRNWAYRFVFFFLEERCARVSLGVLSVLSVRLDFTSVPLKDSKANVLASQPIKSKLL